MNNQKFSECYKPDKKQSDLDFVNIFLYKDIKLFIDPWALKECNNDFGLECISYINSFFDLLISRISNKEGLLAKEMLHFCHEVKEIHLGNAIDNFDGLGMDDTQTDAIYNAMSNSEAVNSGSVKDLEDCALMIDGINRDKISDMIANIIKIPLTRYTEEQCILHDIETEEVSVGYCWDNYKKEWVLHKAKLPLIDNKKENFIILVPKWIVRRDLFLQYGDYFDREILEFEQARHLNAGTSLVRVLKDGSLRPPSKVDLKELIPRDKKTVSAYTRNNPDLLGKYKNRKANNFKPIGNDKIIKLQTGDNYNIIEDFDDKKNKLALLNTGKEEAYNYHDLMIGILESIFYPDLAHPIKEYPLADKTKKVDIVFRNTANSGFFSDIIKMGIVSFRVYFECKNYSEDVGNEEVDQLAGRLGIKTGKIGFLLCRKINDADRLERRCKFIADNQGSYIICLEDEDILNFLEMKKNGNKLIYDLFLEKLEKLR